MKKGILLSVILLLAISTLFLLPYKKTETLAKEHPGFYEQWLEWKKDVNGEIPESMYSTYMAHDLSMMGIWNRRAGDNPIEEVVELGPTEVAGRTRALMAHPDNDNVIFAGGISGGLWKSSDKGSSWAPINDHQASLMVSCITMNPFNKNEIYYGTGESRANSASVNGDGIFKSSDGGKTFTQLAKSNATALRNVWCIEHSLTDSNTIYAGTNTSGVYYSDDKGSNWQKLPNTFGSITDIEVLEDGTVLCGEDGSGVYKITPGSTAFVKMTLPSAGTYRRVEVEKCKKYPKVVYTALEGTGNEHKVYKSSNGGTTWLEMSPSNPGTAYSRYCFDLAVHPNDTNELMVSSISLNWSIDGGSNWVSGVRGHADHHSHTYLNGNNGDDVLLGSDGGVTLHSFANPSQAIRINNGYKVTQFYAGNYGPSGDTWIAGTQDNGTHRNINTVHKKVFGGDGGYAHISQQNPNLAYFSTQRGNTYRTTNFNASIQNRTTISTPTMIAEGVNFINQYYMNPADDGQLYYRTGQGLWRTVDSGSNWTKIGNIGGINVITSSVEKNPIVYFGRSASRIYRIDSAATTTNLGQVALNANRPAQANSGTVLGIEVHPKDRNTIFVAYSNNSTLPRIWKIENCDNPDSLVWTNVSGNLPSGLPVNDIAMHPQAPDSILFAATDFGLYYSTDSGSTWEKEMKVPSVAIFKIEMRASDNNAFLFTHGRGVWRITASRLKWDTDVKYIKAIDFAVSPNPVSDGKLSIDFNTNVINSKIRIIDLQGKVVRKLSSFTNETIDVSNLKSGMYFIELTRENKKGIQKILILN